MKVCWNLTNICNEDCFYCFRELREQAKCIEDNVAILYKLNNLHVSQITFSGGEPFLYPSLDVLLSYSKELGIKNAIVTNGSCLNKDNILTRLKNIDKITFSIDSPSEYVNEGSGRGKEHYQHIKEILPYIKAFYPHMEIEINSVVTRNNINEIDFMFEAINSELCFYGIKKWKISRFSPLRGYALERKNLLSVPDQVFEAIKNKYDGKKALFEISVRDLNNIDDNLIISPNGSLKKSVNALEQVIVPNILTTDTHNIKRTLKLGGYYV